MTTPHSRFGNTRAQIYLLCVTAFVAWASAYSQQTVPPTESYVRIGRAFLRALYPELNGKKYTVKLETSVSYDDPESVPKYFMLDVGAGAKYAVMVEINVNAGLAKQFSLTERFRLQFEGTFANVLNHPNFDRFELTDQHSGSRC